MVADFGIALAVSAAAGGRMTETGTSVGTPHYMSPEQATADREITGRADQYSLASVLYEMLAGEPPHTGASAQAVIMKIITDAARPVSELRKSVPPNVAAAVAKALEKLPADRFESAKDFAAALQNPAFTTASGVPSGSAAAGPRPRAGRLVVGVAGVVGVALGAVAAWMWLRPHPEPVARFVIGFPAEQAPDFSLLGTHMTVSPDGSMLVYSGGVSVDATLWLKRRDALTAEPIPGTEGAFDPFFSPDGRQVGFVSDRGGRSLKIISLAGGTPNVVAGAPLGVSGAWWATDGYIYFDADTRGLERVKPDGTARESVMPLDSAAHEVGIAWPQVLPGAEVAIFRLRHSNDVPGDFTIVALRIGTTDRREVVRAVTARYASGQLLFVTADGTLQAAPFDTRQLALAGPPAGLARGVRVYGTYAGADLAFTADGDLYYVAGSAGAASALEWVTRDGVAEPVDTAWHESGEIRSVALSPNGEAVALELARLGSGGADIWIEHLPAGPLTRLTLDSADDFQPSWSGDGRDVLFASERVSPLAVFRRRADGTGDAVLVARSDRDIHEAYESRDGQWLVARTSLSMAGSGDILAMEIGRDTALQPIIATAATETSPALSPDGRWLAYVSTESGRREVYVRPFPDVNRGVWQISTDGGVEPRWSHTGREIFFRGITTLDMMAVDVETTPEFRRGTPRSLFHSDAASGQDYARYDVALDDRRFLMVGQGSGALPRLVRVEHFLRDLKRGTSQ
jgi:serine/threonine-protein kinase